MIKKLGELKIDQSADYHDTVAKALEKAGYTLVLEYDGVSEKHYIIAEAVNKEKNNAVSD